MLPTVGGIFIQPSNKIEEIPFLVTGIPYRFLFEIKIDSIALK